MAQPGPRRFSLSVSSVVVAAFELIGLRLRLARQSFIIPPSSGRAWISTVRRLRQINCLPKQFLFTVKVPTDGEKREMAAREICHELEALDTVTVSFAETNRILEFARAI